MNELMPKRLNRTTIYECDHVCLYSDRVALPSGNIIENYYQIHYPKKAVAVVIMNEKEEILLIQNRRYTVDRLEWEVPAGRIEDGESPEDAALREAMEETGCELSDLQYLCQYNPSNGMSDSLVHCFCAKVLSEKNFTDSDEINSKKWFSKQEYLDLLRLNGTRDGVTILAILYALQFC
ncbi:NUDIX hydrolase [Butyrivibrio fibrisolvens]|uniref:NUDIX hydrolase n=1 Tax=Butyrivibrio fibrisolvens TaxID=831 RepID=UPI000418CBE8|nr:NUDIX hydrolase [Butyrivibrio fibrisolvens]